MTCTKRTVSNILRGWRIRRTPDSSAVERCLRRAGFERVDAYCFNAASIRVRVVSSKFCNLDGASRFELVNEALSVLSDDLLSDIVHVTLLTNTEARVASTVVDARTLANALAELCEVSRDVSVSLLEQMLTRNYEFEYVTFDVPLSSKLRHRDST